MEPSHAIDLNKQACYGLLHRVQAVRDPGERKRLYLRVGDEVTHLRYEEWGIGVVMEVMTSSVPGGTCLARIRFQDGQLRCFSNDLDNESCCYYFGVRRYWNPAQGVNAVRSNFFVRGELEHERNQKPIHSARARNDSSRLISDSSTRRRRH
jgi:hypothetical protein